MTEFKIPENVCRRCWRPRGTPYHQGPYLCQIRPMIAEVVPDGSETIRQYMRGEISLRERDSRLSGKTEPEIADEFPSNDY